MFLLEKDALNGKEGTGFLTINGEIHEMFSMKNMGTSSAWSLIAITILVIITCFYWRFMDREEVS